MKRRNLLTMICAATTVSLIGGTAMADWTPKRPINVTVPYGAGGGTDSIARALAAALGDVLPVPIVVVNRPGASGVVGSMVVKNGASDGSNVMITSAGSFVLNAQMRELEVDPFEDFVIVSQIGDLRTSLMVAQDSEYKTIEDLIEAARTRSEKLRWSHTGKGSFHHIAGLGFLTSEDLEAVDVPFQGGANTRAAVIGGQVDFGMIGIQQLSGFEDKLRPLAVVAAERDLGAPDVPTFAEIDLNVPVITSPIMVMMPKDTPTEIVEALDAAIATATASDLFAERMAVVGSVPEYLDSEDALTKLQTLRDAAAPVIQSLE